MKVSPKVKLFVALSSIALTIIATLSCTAFVLAMPTGSAKALFASYSADHVSAVVSATYQIEGKEKVDFVSSAQDKYLVLSEQSSAAGFVAPENLTLFANSKSIMFSYTFSNTGSKDMSVCLSLPENITNIKVVETCNEMPVEGHKIVVEAGKTLSYNICAQIENVANDANFSGSFNFVLSNII